LEFLDGLRQELAFPEIAKTKDWEIRGFWGLEGNWFLEWTFRADKNVRPTGERQKDRKTERQKDRKTKTTGNGVPLPMPPMNFRMGLDRNVRTT
jgi:hypothetical protein